MKDRAIEYFAAFNNQDTTKLREIYSEDVVLRDWIVEVSGRENVINENKKGWEANKEVFIGVKNLFYDGDTVIAEIDIFIEDKQGGNVHLKVADILEFRTDSSNQAKLVSIREYLGNS